MNQALKVFLISVMLFTLAGCFDDVPNQKAIHDQIAEQTEQNTLGMFRLVKVEKLNSFKPDDKHYQVKVRQVFEVVKTPDEVLDEIKQRRDLSPLQKMGASLVVGAVKMAQPNLGKGDSFSEEKAYEFIKTEKGWHLSRTLEDSQL